MSREEALAELRRSVTARRSDLQTEVGVARTKAERAEELRGEVARHLAAREVAERVSGVLSKLASDRDAAARMQVEQLVSSGLNAVFGESGEQLSFHLIESTQRNAASVDFIVRTTKPDGEVIDTDVMSARGGGVAAMIGVLLRVVLILLTRQTGQPVSSTLVLDESLAMLSADRLEAASAFLRTLVDSAGIQVIMVTHQPELTESADVVHRLSLSPDGVTRVSKG